MNMNAHVEAYYDHLYWEAEAAEAATQHKAEDFEASSAWSDAFERDDEARLEMEADEERYGSFSDLLEASR